MLSDPEFTATVVEKARSLGASVAGVADIGSMKASPSHLIAPKIGMDPDVLWQHAPDEVEPTEIAWPPDASAAVVIGVVHSIRQPELDWYDGKGTPGNRILIRVVKELSEWLEDTHSVKTYRPPYFIEKGGVFLKDAAVLAGLGSIGQNNIVVTPEYGPRVRWRALLLGRSATATGPLDFDPCDGCPQPCRKACPVGAFENTVYSSSALGQSILPGINGSYDRFTCNTKMSRDVEEAARALAASDEEGEDLASTMNAFEEVVMTMPKGEAEPQYGVKYCRRCELSCPVGRGV